jgi:hypothetical protein
MTNMQLEVPGSKILWAHIPELSTPFYLQKVGGVGPLSPPPHPGQGWGGGGGTIAIRPPIPYWWGGGGEG